MDDLTILADKYGSDKGSIKHNYTKIYDKYFRAMQKDEFNLMEIGVAKGASIKMWAEYFKYATIIGVDIAWQPPNDELIHKLINDGKFEFFSADQSSFVQMSKVIEDDRKFGIIIDDGSHKPEDEAYTFGILFPFLLPGGIYVMEDLNCKRSHNSRFEVKERKMLNILNDYNKTGEFNSNLLEKYKVDYIVKHISKVDMYNGKIAFIRKA